MDKKFILDEDTEVVNVSEEPVKTDEINSEVIEEEPTEELSNDAVAGLLHSTLTQTWSNIETLQSYISTLNYQELFPEIVETFSEIIKDNMIHIGMLEKALTYVSPEAALIIDGSEDFDDLVDKTEE